MNFLFSNAIFSQPVPQCACGESGIILVENGPGANKVKLSALINTGILPPTEFNGCLKIKGKLLVDLVAVTPWATANGFPYTFGPNATILMDPGSIIEIETFCALKFSGAVIKGCDKLWESITVKSYASLDMQGTAVSDGFNAVSMNSLSNVLIKNNFFNSNYNSLYAANQSPASVGAINLQSPITGNQFACTYDLLPHYNPAVTISIRSNSAFRVQNLKNFVIGDPNNPTSNPNGVINHIHGVWATKAYSLSVFGTYMEDIMPTTHGDDAKEAERGAAVRLDRSSGVLLLDNTFNKVNFGVWMNESEADIQHNTITTNRDLVPYGGSIGVFIKKATNRNIQIRNNNTFILPRPAVGVRSIDLKSQFADKKLTVENNTFISPFEILPPLAFGVQLWDATGPMQFSGNVFPGLRTAGIQLINCNAIIDNKPMGLIKDNISTNPEIGVASGFVLQNSTGFQVVGNRVTGFYTTSGLLQFGFVDGIRAQSSPNNLFCCNEFTGSTWGLTFTWLCPDTRVWNTSFGRHNTGLLLDGQTDLPQQINRGNKWKMDSCKYADAEYGGTNVQSIISASRFEVSSPNMPNGLSRVTANFSPFNVNDWWAVSGTDPNCEISPTYCGETPTQFTGGGGNGPGLTNVDIESSQPTTDYSAFGLGLKWSQQEYLFQKGKANPALIAQNASVGSFFNQAETSTIGKFYYLKKSLFDLHFADQTKVDSLLLLRNMESQFANAIRSLQKTIRNPATPTADRDVAKTSLSDQSASEEPILAKIATLEQELSILQKIKADQLIAQNAAISTSQIFESNQKQVNDIYLKTFGKDTTEISTAQLQALAAIALQCPETGGKAVYQARWMHQSFTHTEMAYPTSGACTPANRSSVQAQNPIGTLSPNPGSGYFQYAFEKPLDGPATVFITNLTGATVFSRVMLKNEATVQLDLGHLAPGIYVFEVRSGARRLAIQKLVISKP